MMGRSIFWAIWAILFGQNKMNGSFLSVDMDQAKRFSRGGI